jgi:hypothetical protein
MLRRTSLAAPGRRLLLLPILVGLASPAQVRGADAVEDVVPGYPFEEGDVIQWNDLERLRNYIPEPFWENREYFFFEGMTLQIGPFHHDYSANAARKQLTAEYGGQARIGKGGALESYTLGRPFPEIDPKDPDAGVKHAWNMDYKHDALEGKATWFFTYWDRGEQLPLWYKGTGWALRLTHRSDQAENGGRVFDKETRKGAGGITINEPFDARGLIGMGYRYLGADKALEGNRRDDVWVYIPWLRRTRRLSASERNDAISGTDATADDYGGFSGIVPHFEWNYLGETEVLAATDTKIVGYPYTESANYGPNGFSYGNDTWQVREVVILEMRPLVERHPYERKTLWVDKQSYVIHFAAAYDRRGQLWKLVQPLHRWSESDAQQVKVPGLRTFFKVADVIVNVNTGTGVRIEHFDVQPTQLSRGQLRRQIDIGRLSRDGK